MTVSDKTIYDGWTSLWQQGFDAVWANYRAWLSATDSYQLGQAQVGQAPATIVLRHGRAAVRRRETNQRGLFRP